MKRMTDIDLLLFILLVLSIGIAAICHVTTGLCNKNLKKTNYAIGFFKYSGSICTQPSFF
jgi:hypothetical protein